MTEFKVGLFTLAALVAFAIAALKITANKALFGDYVTYKAIVRDASGIFPRTAIKVAGINAGTITGIELHGDAALLSFELKEEIQLSNQSFFRIKTVGFLGEKYIDVVVGEPSHLKLKGGDFIKVVGGAGIEDLAKDASDILVEVKEIVKSVRQAIQTDKSTNVLRDILANTNDAISTIKRVVTQNEERLNDIVAYVEQLTKQISYETNASNKDSLMSDLKKVGPLLDDLNVAAKDIRLIIADVKAGKGTVGKLLRDEETVDKVNETLTNVNRLVGRINNLQAELSVYSGYNNRYQGTTDFNIDLYTAPDRFFRAGVVKNDFTYVTEETETETSGTAGNTFENKKVTDKDKFRFNLQLGRTYQQWRFRIGLIESKGGFGVDYDINSWATRFTAEIFDFDRDDKPSNLRLSSEIKLWNILFTKLTLEDVLDSQISYTIHGGIKFTDDDIASLIGLMAR